MAVKVFLARVRAGVLVLDSEQVLPEGLRVSVVADLPEETGLVAVDPEDAELIRALHDGKQACHADERAAGRARLSALREKRALGWTHGVR